MKCSVELPIKNLELSKLFDYDYIIASTCLSHGDYYDYYMNNKRPGTILDNGAFENGAAIDDSIYIDLASKLQPSIVIIPDVLFSPYETLNRFWDFMQLWKKRPTNLKDTQLMGVIQANGSLEMAHMMGVLYNSHGIDWIGMPYASKLDRYSFIASHPEFTNVHILGCPTFPEAMSLFVLENVRSIDSSLPVKVTKDNVQLFDVLFSNSYVKPDDSSLNNDLLVTNLGVFRCVCHGEFTPKFSEFHNVNANS